jgi:hypothetical protein
MSDLKTSLKNFVVYADMMDSHIQIAKDKMAMHDVPIEEVVVDLEKCHVFLASMIKTLREIKKKENKNG